MQKDNNGNIITWICPRCGKETNDYPALSRIDNKTDICAECGMAEALFNLEKHINATQNDK